ncbi:OmpA family protein [Nonomuraea sp. KC401]|uniref:OmpA family protein n=1 Tax=unclassified Nonomuraea TaxID=2593643 RepID=UPI0010FDECE1|nr:MULTISPECIES: OmpA family protein [unclassified Nonomuraea]NBE98900.1 OmpA family protein [Nonomuraea sp. K271]TLF59349.1 OmpA family protein [Nonomuraea sp. KC401]
MYRSASALALSLLVALTPSPSPSAPVQVPVEGGQPATAPVLDISGEILDISERISNLDESVTNETSGRERTITVAADVLFAFDKATLTGKAERRLEQVAELLKAEAAGKPVKIDGYTDAKGSGSYNLELSRKRAEAVRDALGKLAPGTEFAVAGHGEAGSVAPNALPDGGDNPKGRAKNRRVEIGFTR